jgi:hypothetical protein
MFGEGVLYLYDELSAAPGGVECWQSSMCKYPGRDLLGLKSKKNGGIEDPCGTIQLTCTAPTLLPSIQDSMDLSESHRCIHFRMTRFTPLVSIMSITLPRVVEGNAAATSYISSDDRTMRRFGGLLNLYPYPVKEKPVIQVLDCLPLRFTIQLPHPGSWTSRTSGPPPAVQQGVVSQTFRPSFKLRC